MRQQLALPFGHRPSYAAEDFLADPSNADARIWLAAPRWPGGRLVLWGEAGTGKTHLLHIWAARQGGMLCDGAALPPWPRPPGADLAIDDADRAPEAALLHVLNAAAEAGRRVLLAAARPPAAWPAQLPDLASRLRAAAATGLRPPGDALLHSLLTRLLSDRQMTVPPDIADWLLARLPRSPAVLRDAVSRLDRAAWGGHRVTRALATEALSGLLFPETADHGTLPP